MLRHRLISSVVLVPIVIAILFLLSLTWFSIVMLCICTLAAWEWSQLSGFDLNKERVLLVVIFSLILAFFSQLKHSCLYSLFLVGCLQISLGWWFIAFFLVLFYPYSATIWRHSRVLRVIFGFFTIVPFFLETLALRFQHYDQDCRDGALRLLYVVVVVWGMDIGGYIFGKLFGKNKFFSRVSPEKTWQGFFGGLLTSIVVSYGYCRLVCFRLTPLMSVIFSVLISLASVLGDFTESMLKREAGIKDSSCLIPGHGGLLDRIDGLMAAIPVFSYLLRLE